MIHFTNFGDHAFFHSTSKLLLGFLFHLGGVLFPQAQKKNFFFLVKLEEPIVLRPIKQQQVLPLYKWPHSAIATTNQRTLVRSICSH